MNRPARKRALITCVLLAGCFTAFSARLIHIQVVRHLDYAGRAAAVHVNRQILHARRGIISDIHGEPMAQNEPVKKIIVNPTKFKDPAALTALATLLSEPLDLTPEVILAKLNKTIYSQKLRRDVVDSYVPLKRGVAQSVADKIIADMLASKVLAKYVAGVFFEQEARRVYPNNELLCHVLGFVNGDDTGLDGVELTMNKYLRGHDGFRYIERDLKGNEIVPYRGQEHSARDGSNIRLTIDMGLQNIVEQELEAAVKEFRPKGATVIMMNPKTGQILALANRPNFNLNSPKKKEDTASRMNLAISAQVEPGSTFKIVAVAGALQEGKITPDSFFDCERGFWEWCKLRDSHPLADISANDILVHSSNIGVAKIAMRLGEQKFFEYIHRFGYGEQTGIGLPGEIPGDVRPLHRWDSLSITRMPMGQGIAATPLQIATSMCAIANGGSLMLPQIIQEITDDQGGVVASFPPRQVRRVVSQKVSNQVRAALIDVTGMKGTAKGARVPGYSVAGKTGTAQKVENGVYARDKYVCSFVGFMPAEDPAFVMLVLLDEAQTKPGLNYGGLTAAPVFSRIGERAARYLGLVPKFDEAEGAVVAKQGREGRNFRAQ